MSILLGVFFLAVLIQERTIEKKASHCLAALMRPLVLHAPCTIQDTVRTR